MSSDTRMTVAITKSRQLTFKLTVEQARAIERRAKQCGMRTGAWIRNVLVQVAGARPAAIGRSSDGYIRIREPDGKTS